MSKHVLYNKYYKSDIFNSENINPIEKPSKKYYPTTFQRTNSDIFNIDNKKDAFENKIKNMKKQNKPHSLYNSKSQSDIFFTKKPIKRENNNSTNNRNLSNRSTVFSHCKEREKPVKKNLDDFYNPNKYYSKDTSFKRLCKQFYESENLNYSKDKISSRGYILNENNKINNSNEKRILSPYRKKIPWSEINSTGVKYINQEDKSGNVCKRNRINVQKSNIFFQDDNINVYSNDDIRVNNNSNNNINYNNYENNFKSFDGKNKIMRINVKKIDDKENDNNIENDNNKNNGFQTDRTDYNAYKTKWEKTLLDWKNSDTEIMFAKHNDKRNLSNWERKQNELMESSKYYKPKYELPKSKIDQNSINYDNRLNLKKIKNIIDSQTNLPEDQKKRFMLNSSSSYLYDQSFYERNMQYKNSQNKEKEHEYVLTPEKYKNEKNNLDLVSIKKILRDKGFHIYDISTVTNNITGNNKEIKFKIRENEGEKYKNHIYNIKEQLLKDKGINMEPVKKISVNKKYNPSYENQFFGINQVYPDENDRKPKKKFNNDKNTKFTDEFKHIDGKYKNRGIKSLRVDF